MLRFLILVGSIVWAGTAPMAKPLKHYFIAQFLYMLGTQIILNAYGTSSRSYALSYFLLTIVILAAVVEICWHYVTAHRAKWIVLIGAGLSATFLAAIAQTGLESVRLSQYVILFEATVLVGAGVAIGFIAPYLAGKNCIIALTFSILWLMQAAYFYGFLLHFDSALWRTMNYVVPTWLCVAAFSWLGWKLRAKLSAEKY